MVVVTSVISRGLCLLTDSLRDLEQKLLLSYLAVALPRDVAWGCLQDWRLGPDLQGGGWIFGCLVQPVQCW